MSGKLLSNGTDLDLINAVFALMRGERDAFDHYLEALGHDTFATGCELHQIPGYCYTLLNELAGEDPAVAELLARLEVWWVTHWARNERQIWALRGVSEVLAEAGIPFILLKGLYLARRFYGDLAHRAIGDLDILVRRADFSGAIKALESHGFALESGLPFGRDAALDHVFHVQLEKDELEVEIHHALRIHPSLRLDEEAIWGEAGEFELAGSVYRVLPESYSLLLQLLQIHFDISLGETTLRNFVDLYRVLEAVDEEIDWESFFEARGNDGSLKICVNVLSLFLTITSSEHEFPVLTESLVGYRELLVGRPDRFEYLELLRQTSFWGRKKWPFRVYDAPLPSTVAWWVRGLPFRVAAHRESFVKRARGGATAPRWPLELGKGSSTNGSLPVLHRDFEIDSGLLQSRVLRFGSWKTRFFYSRDLYREMVEELFRLGLEEESGDDPEPIAANLVVFDTDWETLRRYPRRYPTPGRGIVHWRLENTSEIHHDIASACIHRSRHPWEVLVPMVARGQSREHLLHCLMVVLYKLLFLNGRMQLHAAAAKVNGAVNLFVGGKGAGKSTISLRLGKAGAEILSEDHVMLHRANGSYLVAGCDGLMRLTEKTERYFFRKPLEITPRDHAGVPKKQISMEEVITATPYRDYPVSRIFFPRVSDEFAISPLEPQTALLRLLASVEERHRFSDADDRAAFLDYFCNLLDSTELYELELSEQLSDLDRLEEFLGGETTNRPE